MKNAKNLTELRQLINEFAGDHQRYPDAIMFNSSTLIKILKEYKKEDHSIVPFFINNKKLKKNEIILINNSSVVNLHDKIEKS